jgi:hypothetical protein
MKDKIVNKNVHIEHYYKKKLNWDVSKSKIALNRTYIYITNINARSLRGCSAYSYLKEKSNIYNARDKARNYNHRIIRLKKEEPIMRNEWLD